MPAKSPDGPNAKQSMRLDIQGMRAIAVLAVIVTHVNSQWLTGGFLGVDVFFVISGFLITGIVLREREAGDFSLLRFYHSRLKRIAPAYYISLAVTTVFSAILFIQRDFDFYKQSLQAALYFSSNTYFATFVDYFAPTSGELPLLHMWSLAVEMQFYLFLPLITALVPVKYWRIVFPVLLLISIGNPKFADYITYGADSYFDLTNRFPEFLLGCCLATYSSKIALLKLPVSILAWTGFVLLTYSFVSFSQTTIFANFMGLLPCVGTVLILATPRSAVGRLLAIAPLVWIGNLSFSLYLWHWPVLAFFRYYEQRSVLSAPEVILIVLFTFGLAYLSYRFVETPFRRGGSLWNALAIAATAVTAILAMAISQPLNQSVVTPLSTPQSRFGDPATICNGKIIGSCLRGDKDADREILVIGDSHAAQLNYFFDEVGVLRHLRARVITVNGCVNFPGSVLEPLPEFKRVECVAQTEAAMKFFDRADYLVVAGLWSYHSESGAFMDAFDNFLGTTDRLGKKVVVLAQIPLLTANVARVDRFEKLGIPTAISLDERGGLGNQRVKNLVARHSSAKFLDLSHIELFGSAPFYHGELIYRDNNHLNEIGSALYGKAAVSQFQ